MTALFYLGLGGFIGIAICAVTAWMERTPESKAYWDRMAERVFRV